MQSKLKELRLKKKLSKTELGNILNMERHLISRIENCDLKMIRPSDLVALCKFFNVSVKSIMDLSDEIKEVS